MVDPGKLLSRLRGRTVPQRDKIVRTRAGGYQVLARDDLWDGARHSFSENVYPFGDLTPDLATAQLLHTADPGKAYQTGECGVLANELWNRHPAVREFYVLTTPEEPVDGVHQLVQLPDGTYADSLGIWSEAALLTYWRGIEPQVRLAPYDDGEPVPPKNAAVTIGNQALYDAVVMTIDRHLGA